MSGFSLSVMFSSFIHIVSCVSASFLFKANDSPLYGYTTFVYSLINILVISTFWLSSTVL